ncbi:MAG: hypothetical protein K940chlam2_01509 [Chlamydiae bacterium]|nr:hypothetical protein [Chlamydiota bacterium]
MDALIVKNARKRNLAFQILANFFKERAHLRSENRSFFKQKIAAQGEANPKVGWLKRRSSFLEKGAFCTEGTFRVD